MADQNVTQLTEATTLADADLVYAVVDPAGTPVDRKVTVANLKSEIVDSVESALTPTTGAVSVDMSDADIYTHDLTGDPTYTTSNRVAGSSVLVRVAAGGAARTPSFPVGWRWLSAEPTEFASGEVGVLGLLVSGGTAETDVLASYVAEVA